MELNVEEITWSLIEHNVRFINDPTSMRDIFLFRKNNMKITQMIWITKQPIIDNFLNLYNPKALIIIVLN